MTATARSRHAETESPLTLLYPDLEGELKTTRRVLERVPDGNNEWRPHEKSMTLGGLATHLAHLPGFGIAMLTSDEFDPMKRPPSAKPANTEERLKLFGEVSEKLRELLSELTWDQTKVVWRIKSGDRVFMEGPRGVMLRSALITHMAHHRAQLGVYLRLLGVAIPGSYGPSADEPFP
ncbi:MAG TPA: DinB family protein [Gemmatimonadaceae bacterium]|nr:DinB family protein [Gemmatimonadaceae bacterium]